MFKLLTKLRHGPLKRLRFLWSILRVLYRVVIAITPNWSVSKMIGPYGPFKLDKRFAFSNFSRWGGRHNRGFTACIDHSSGMHTVFDIGAHIGLVAMPLARAIKPTGTVYAFEPASSNRRFLEQHLKANKIENVEVIGDLVGHESDSAVEFFESTGDSGMNTIADTGRRRGYEQTTVNQITLDEFCATRDLKPELIKIDTEGAELNILRGAADVLKNYRPTIYLSVHPRHIAELGGTVEQLEKLLDDSGYAVTDMDHNVVRPTELTEYIISPAEQRQQEDQ